MSVKGEDRKIQRARRAVDGDDFHWHKCRHNKWLAGVEFLSNELVGAYARIVFNIYKRRAVLPADFEWLAGQFRCSKRKARALVEQLAAAKRIVFDEEAGIIYDEAAVKELVDNQVLREKLSDYGKAGAQAKKAKRSAQKTEPKTARISAENDLNAASISSEREGEPPENNDLAEGSAGARLVLISSKTESESEDTSSEPPSTTSARRSPLRSGGAPDAAPPVDASNGEPGPDLEARLAKQRERMRAAYPDEFTAEAEAAAETRLRRSVAP